MVLLAQLLEVVGSALALDAGVPLVLALWVAVGEGVGLGLTLVPGLKLVLPVSLGVALAVPVVLLLALAVLVLAEASVLVLAVVVVELACAAALDELAGADEHEERVVAAVCLPDVVPITAPPPSPAPPPLRFDEPGAELCEVMPSTELTISWRIGGTAARTMPTANTAKPTAKAGRRMASRQSRGRCACRGRSGLARWVPGALCPWRSACQPRVRAAFQRHTRSASILTAAAMPRVSRNLPALA